MWNPHIAEVNMYFGTTDMMHVVKLIRLSGNFFFLRRLWNFYYEDHSSHENNQKRVKSELVGFPEKKMIYRPNLKASIFPGSYDDDNDEWRSTLVF